MLWQIGVIALLIDVFYRVSVPIDHLFETKKTTNSSDSSVEVGNITVVQIQQQPYEHEQSPTSVLIDEKGVALLLERLQEALGKEGRSWLLSLQKSLEKQSNNTSQKKIVIVQDKVDKVDKITASVHYYDKSVPPQSIGLPPFNSITSNSDPIKKKHDHDGSLSASEGMYQGKEEGPRGAKESSYGIE